MTSTAPILGFEASVLFDSGATHSFISIVFIRLSRLFVRTSEPCLAVTTPVGKTVVCKCVVCKCPISICGRVLPANLVVLPMSSYNIILGMDWLTMHLAVIDCALKQVMLTPRGEGKVMHVGSRARSLALTILSVQARKLTIGGNQVFLAFIVSPTKQQRRIWKIFLWCASIQVSFQQTTLDYHHIGRWSLGLSIYQALILSLRHHIGWHLQS
jgi:hypothetical protein